MTIYDTIFPENFGLQNISPTSFPDQGSFPNFPAIENDAWNEEWKTRTMDEIQTYFFPDSKITKKGGIIISDATGVFKDVVIESDVATPCPCTKDAEGNCISNNPDYSCFENEQGECECIEVKELDEIEIDNFANVAAMPLDLEAIEIRFFTSKDGANLLRAWKNAQESIRQNPRTLAIFMETEDSFNIFGSVMNFVVGEEVRKHFKSDYWQKVFDFINKNEINVSQSDIKELMNDALSKPNTFDFISKVGNSLMNKAIGITLNSFELIFKGVSDSLEKLKFTEDQWNGSNEDAPFYLDIDEKYTYKILEKVKLLTSQNIRNVHKELKNIVFEANKTLPASISTKLDKVVDYIGSSLYGINTAISNGVDFLKVILTNGKRVLNAFICGFINGFIDFIKSIFDIGLLATNLVKASNDFNSFGTYYRGLVVEYLENYIEAILKFDFINFAFEMFQLMKDSFINLINFIKSISLPNISLPNINLNAIAYYTGFIIFGIVQIIIEIYLTGGSATLARLSKEGAEVVTKAAKKAARVSGDILSALSRFIKMLRKGSKEVVTFFKQIIDDFFEWLKKKFKSDVNLKPILNADGLWEYTNKSGTKLKWRNQQLRPKDIEKSIKTKLNSKNLGDKWEAEVADEISKYHEITSFNNEVRNSLANDITGDIDVATDKYFIECKTTAGRNFVDRRIRKQLKKYLEKDYIDYMNGENKKVILAIKKLEDPEILENDFLKEMKKLGLIIITDFEQLKKLK